MAFLKQNFPLAVIEPMLPTLVARPFSNPAWLFEPKWDGYRAISYFANGSISFISRRRNDLTPKFPDLQNISKLIKADAAILDGEIVAIDPKGMPRFEGLRSKVSGFAVVYYAFDLLHVDGEDLMQLPVTERKARLKRILPRRNTGKLRFTEHVIGDGLGLFKQLEKTRLEGMVAKRMDSLYVSGRTRAWLKLKTRAGKAEMEKRSEAWHG